MMKRISIIVLLFMAVTGFSGIAVAADQKDKSDDQYYPKFPADEDMHENRSKKNMLSSGVQYGGWVTPTFIYQETPQLEFIPPYVAVPSVVPSYTFKKDQLATSVTTFRVWLKTYLWDNSHLYVRGKDTATGIVYHNGPLKVERKNVLDLDLGYITAATPDRDIEVTVGRKYFLIGSGLVLNGRGDGAEFNYYSKYINIMALGAWTGWLVKDDNPYGLSSRDIATGAKRVFAGGRLSTSWFNQTLYAFGLAQFDYGKEFYDKNKLDQSLIVGFDTGVISYSQKSRYDSQYYGIGLEGVIISGLSYSGEFIMERGKSYLTEYSVTGSVSDYLITGSIKKDIVAYAGILNINYYIDVLLKPVFMVQYAFGSGDVNRSDYRSTGNTWGKDRGFIYFGTFVGGYALKPILANMHVISGSVSFSPFSWVKLSYVKNMTLIAKYLYYLKYKDFSPINYGLDATRPDRDIGHGFDLSLRWLIFSDFSFFLNYGLFVPGKAFGYYYDYQSAQSIVKQIGYYGSAIFGSLNNYPLNKITYSSTAYRHFVMGGFNTSF